LIAGASVTAASALPAQAAAPPTGKQAPSVYRYKVGSFEVTALYDGVWYRPIDDKFVRKADYADVRREMSNAFMPEEKLATPFTTVLVNTGKKLILLDTGTGGQIASTAGSFSDNLRAAGIDPKTIDQIMISHFHPDHINGIKTKDNALIFPNAEIMVPEAEWKFWADDANMRAAPDGLKIVFHNVRRIFTDIAKDVTHYRPGKEVASGIEAVDAAGHTPGHTVFALLGRRVADGAERHDAAPGAVRAPSRMAAAIRHRRTACGRNAQEAARPRRRRPHAGHRLSLPVPGLRSHREDRDRLRARAAVVEYRGLTFRQQRRQKTLARTRRRLTPTPCAH